VAARAEAAFGNVPGEAGSRLDLRAQHDELAAVRDRRVLRLPDELAVDVEAVRGGRPLEREDVEALAETRDEAARRQALHVRAVAVPEERALPQVGHVAAGAAFEATLLDVDLEARRARIADDGAHVARRQPERRPHAARHVAQLDARLEPAVGRLEAV